MCAAHLRSHGVPVVEFNAWQQSHTGNPLVDLVSAVSGPLGKNKTKAMRDAAMPLGWHLAEFANRGLITSEMLKGGESRLDEAWDAAEKQVEEFTERLREVASDGDGPLVVIVDELDRCRPAHALSLLETVRHLFAADGVMVILTINRKELRRCVESIFGAHFDADRYPRR